MSENTNLYETDFHAWTQQQKKLLAAEKYTELDLSNLIEEIDSLGKQERNELRNRLGILLGHLLKWHYQPSLRCKSCLCTVKEQRVRILEHLQDNPSLQSCWSSILLRAYQDGLRLIERETPIDVETLPQTCPFTDHQIFTEMLHMEDGEL